MLSGEEEGWPAGMERVARAHDAFLGAQLFQFSKAQLPEYPVMEIQTSALLGRPVS